MEKQKKDCFFAETIVLHVKNQLMKEKKETLEFIISRIDNYIDSSQNKNNLFLALNTILLGGIITLISSNVKLCPKILLIILGAISVLATISILITIKSIIPYLNGAEDKSDSILFFNDINKTSQQEFFDKINTISDTEYIKDLSGQTHSLSKGLDNKYQLLKINGWIVGLEFTLLLIWIFIYIIKNN